MPKRRVGVVLEARRRSRWLIRYSVWWDDRWVVRQLATDPGRRPALKVWLDVGTGEHRMVKGARLLYRMLVRRGWRPGRCLGWPT